MEAGALRVFTDIISGKRFDRPALAELIDHARPGDRLCIIRLDRLGRSLRELLETVDDLKARGIHLLSLEERLDTSSAAGELVFHVFGAIAHFERRLISERTRDGIAAARKRGRTPGRPPLDPDTVSAAQKLIEAGLSPARSHKGKFSDLGRDSTPGAAAPGVAAGRWIEGAGRRRDPPPRPRKRPRLPFGGVAQDSHRRFAGSRVPAQRISCAVARDIRGLARVRLREGARSRQPCAGVNVSRSPGPSTYSAGATFGGQRSPRLKVTASKGRMRTGASSCAVAISTHSPSRSSKASRVRSAGSTSHR